MKMEKNFKGSFQIQEDFFFSKPVLKEFANDLYFSGFICQDHLGRETKFG